MLQDSMSTDIVIEHAFDTVSEHGLVKHAFYEQPSSLLKYFTEQLSITSQLQLDEVSVDGAHDNHEENSERICALSYNENETTSVNELQQNNLAELLERGHVSASGRNTPLAPSTRETTADQTGKPSGLDSSRSSPSQRIYRSLQPAQRIPQPSVGVRLPLELRYIPNSHNQYILQTVPSVSILDPRINSAATPQFYIPSGRTARGHFNSLLESPNAAATTSSSLISGTEGDPLTTNRQLPTRDGSICFQNGPTQATHYGLRKHAQINVHREGEIGSDWNKQHLVQTQQQGLLMTNSYVPQCNYSDNLPFVDHNEMLKSGLHAQANNYEKPCTYLPSVMLPNVPEIAQTPSRRQAPSIEHKTACPQADVPLQVNTRCNNSDSFRKYVKENCCEILRRSPLHQTNQHCYSSNSTHYIKKPQLNGYAPRDKFSTQQSVDMENYCGVQNPYSIHGHYEYALKNKNMETPHQQSNTDKNNVLFHLSAEAITERIVDDKTQTKSWSKKTEKSQFTNIKVQTNQVRHRMSGNNNVILGKHWARYDYNKPNTCNEQDVMQATRHDELTARHAHELIEQSNQPRGLFNGQLLSDNNQQKTSEMKKPSPQNTCVKETAQHDNLKHFYTKNIQKNKTYVDRNIMYTPPTQFTALHTDLNIEKIKQKEFSKYKKSFTSDNRFSQKNFQKVDSPIDEDVKLLDEKSLQEPMMGLPTWSNREQVSGRDMLDLAVDRSHSLKATPSSTRNRGDISQTLEQCKSSYRQGKHDSVHTVDADKRNCLKQMTHKENGVPVRRGKHQMQTNNKGMHNVKETSRQSCLEQISHEHCKGAVEHFVTNNTFNSESPEANFRDPYAHHLQENTKHNRMLAYTKQSHSVNDLGGVPYSASNHQNIRPKKQHCKTTENETGINTYQNHKVPPDYINKCADDIGAEHFTGYQFHDGNQRLLPILESRNVQSSQIDTYKYGTPCFVTPDLPNKGREHREMSYYNETNVLVERIQNTQCNKLQSQCIPQSFRNNHIAGLLDPTYACTKQSVSSSQSMSNQDSNIVLPCNQVAFAKLPCHSSSASSSSTSAQDTTFKIPYSVDRHTSGYEFLYNETLQSASCYASISTGSDVSMSSDKSVSRSHIVNNSATEKTHSYQHDFVYKNTLSPCNELQQQTQPTPYQQLQQQTHNLQVQLENQNQKDTWKKEHLQLYLHQRDKQVNSQGINGFQSHGFKAEMNLPCFLQSAHSDDIVTTRSCSHLPMMSPHHLHQLSFLQSAQSIQSETLDSFMSSVSEKSHMSTGTSDDCYTDKTQSSEQQIQNTDSLGKQQGTNNTADPSLDQMAPNSRKTAPSLQGASGSSSSVTNPDINIYSSNVPHFLEAISDDIFPPLNFEDCRDAMPLSPHTSPDMNPKQTVTKPDQTLEDVGGPVEHTVICEQCTSRCCKHKNVEPTPNMNAGVGSSKSACDGDSQVIDNPSYDIGAGEAEIVSTDVPFLSGLQDEVKM